MNFLQNPILIPFQDGAAIISRWAVESLWRAVDFLRNPASRSLIPNDFAGNGFRPARARFIRRPNGS